MGGNGQVYGSRMCSAENYVRQPSRVTLSLKSRFQPQAPTTSSVAEPLESEHTDSDDDTAHPARAGSKPTETPTHRANEQQRPPVHAPVHAPVHPPVRPPVRLTPRRVKAYPEPAADVDVLLTTLRTQQDQNAQIQGKINSMLNPIKLSPQPLWGYWIGAMSEEFHPSLLPNFYSDSFALVMHYMNDSNCLRETQQPQQQDTQQTQQPVTIRQHVPLRPSFAVPPPLTQYPATKSGSWNQTIHPLQPIARKSSATATITRRSNSTNIMD